MKYKKGDLVLVKWIDSYSSSRWLNNNEIRTWINDSKGQLLTSVGYIFKYTKKNITLYADIGYEKARIMLIPTKVIRKIKKLK